MSAYFPDQHISAMSFTASEVTRMTTISGPVQRDWRRRGLLQEAEGWARIAPEGVLEIAIREAMSRLGMPHLDGLIDLRDAVHAAIKWAATHVPATIHHDGVDPDLHPATSFLGSPRLRYAWAKAPWTEGMELKLADNLHDMATTLAEDDADPSLGIGVIDLKAVGLAVAQRAAEPLWHVNSGPSNYDITMALRRASEGDVAAQEALSAIGADWKPNDDYARLQEINFAISREADLLTDE